MGIQTIAGISYFDVCTSGYGVATSDSSKSQAAPGRVLPTSQQRAGHVSHLPTTLGSPVCSFETWIGSQDLAPSSRAETRRGLPSEDGDLVHHLTHQQQCTQEAVVVAATSCLERAAGVTRMLTASTMAASNCALQTVVHADEWMFGHVAFLQ